MKIYVGHSRHFDYKSELYAPIRSSSLNQKHTFILPHENSDTPFSSKEFFQTSCDLFIAEVSYPATGLGIELGWADAYGVPVICIYKAGTKPGGSLKVLTPNFIEYHTSEELISSLDAILTDWKS